MSGWVPMPADGWPEIAEALSATGAPWPRPAAVVDLCIDERGRDVGDERVDVAVALWGAQ